jgi:predicted nucleotidyltransferase
MFTVDRDRVIAILRRLLPELRRKFGVKGLAIFGSVARDEATATSDVDVVVEFVGPTSFDAYFDVKEALEGALAKRVDLATPAMLKPRIRTEVEREGVHVA